MEKSGLTINTLYPLACGSGAPSVSQNCWPTRWISLCLRQGRLSGSHFGVLGPEPLVRQKRKKNILVILVYLCSRGAGLVKYYHQNKTAPEPRVRQKRKKKTYFSHFGVLMLQTRPGGWGGSSEVLPPK